MRFIACVLIALLAAIGVSAATNVEIMNPANDAAIDIDSLVDISAKVSAAGDMNISYKLLIDGNVVKEESSVQIQDGYTIDYQWLAEYAGQHEIKVTMKNEDTGRRYTDLIFVTVFSPDTEVVIIKPKDGATVSEGTIVPIKAEIFGSGLVTTEVFVDGDSIRLFSNVPVDPNYHNYINCQWEATEGEHDIEVISTNAAGGNPGEDSITINVE